MSETKSNPSATQTIPNKLILKTSTCKALSSDARITYELAYDDKKSLHIRIMSNSGGGFFSDEWVSLSDIREAFKSSAGDGRISASMLFTLFKGKSVNTPGYILASLKFEGFIKPIDGLTRFYEAIDDKSFNALIKKLQKLAVSSTNP